MPKIYDVVATTGEYTNAQGETKKRYLNCGAIFEKDGRLSLKMEAIPVESNGWFGLYEPKPKLDKRPPMGEPQEHNSGPDPDFDDDIPGF